MSHIGLYCPAETGHLHTMLPLGQELERRGHQVTFFGVLDAKPKVLAAKLDFIPIGTDKFPAGATEIRFAKLAQLSGIRAILYTMDWIRDTAEVFLEQAPEVIKQAQVDALIVDQISPEGGTVADFLNIPFVTLCSALPFNQEANIPPFFTNWLYHPSWLASLRNSLIYTLINPFGKPIQNLRRKYRKKWNLSPEISSDSSKLILSHQPQELEFPRQSLPQHFYFTGPYHNQSSRKQVDFPWEKLTGKPLIYASMGTLQTGLESVFQIIAAACANFDVQLVISFGNSEIYNPVKNLPGNPLIVPYAPQLELLQKTQLFITHAGMNSTLEALTYGVPMVAIPITNDQPGIAARMAWCGAGEVVPLGKLTQKRLQFAIKQVLENPSYQHKALALKSAIQQSGGVIQAADLVEAAIA